MFTFNEELVRGFVSLEFPGGGTWTFATCLGELLKRAEQMAGPRDLSWTILGVEFFGKESNGAQPHTWYPRNCNNIAIRLTRDVGQNPQRAIFQLAHEVCHLISPTGQTGTAPNLEEGFATIFAERMAVEYVNFHCPTPASSPYRQPRDDVESLLALDALALKAIRAIEPHFRLITPQIIAQAVPGTPTNLAERLCRVWSESAGANSVPI